MVDPVALKVTISGSCWTIPNRTNGGISSEVIIAADNNPDILWKIITDDETWCEILLCLPTGLLYQPQMIDDGDCGTIGGMKIGGGNWSTQRKPATVPLRPPQIPHDLT
jgi:hypothetical protein